MIDTAKLRAALAAMTQPLPWTKEMDEPADEARGLESIWRLVDANGWSVCDTLAEPDADAILAALHGAGPLLEELEALRAHAADVSAAVTAWREATGCDGPGEAEQLARDAVVVREGHWDAALAERAAWRTATGCDTPAEAAEVRRRWEAEDAEQASDMARLRELEAAALEVDDAEDDAAEHPIGDPECARAWSRRMAAWKRWDAAIAACRAKREGT